MGKISNIPIFSLDWWGLGDAKKGFDWTVKDLTGVALLGLALGGGCAQALVHYHLFEARLPGLGLLGPLSVVLGILALWRAADALREKNRAWKIWAVVALVPVATSIWVTSTRQDLRAQAEADEMRIKSLERISSADERERYRATLIRDLDWLKERVRSYQAIYYLGDVQKQIAAVRASPEFQAANHCIGSQPRYLTFCADLARLGAEEREAQSQRRDQDEINEIEGKLREAPSIIITSAERIQAGIDAERASVALLARRNAESLTRFWFSLLAYLIVDAAWIFIALRRSELADRSEAISLRAEAAQARSELADHTAAAAQAATQALDAAQAMAAAQSINQPPPSWRANAEWIETPDGRRIARTDLQEGSEDYKSFRRAVFAGAVLPLVV